MAPRWFKLSRSGVTGDDLKGLVPMDDIPPRSYGALIETTLRIITWNVWGLYGPWLEREAAIVATLREVSPDIVVLTESWAKGDDSQCARLAGPLGLPHHTFSGITAQEDKAAVSGVAVMSRWPIRRESSLTFGGARVQFAELSGPRGLIQVYGLVMDAWWFDESQARQDAVRELLTHVKRRPGQASPAHRLRRLQRRSRQRRDPHAYRPYHRSRSRAVLLRRLGSGWPASPRAHLVQQQSLGHPAFVA
jgi:hypothetical protein